MGELISLYDDSLIYFPNIFFPLLSISATIASLFLIKVGILAKEKITIYVEKLEKNFRQIHLNKKTGTKIESLVRRIKNFLITISLIFL